MANNPITPTASSYVNGTIIDAQYMDDLASALNREVGFATQATAASTKTLVLADLSTQEFTGTTAAQVVVMPVVTTLGIGMKWVISNKSTQTIAVNSSGGNLIFTVPAATNWLFTCNAITGTTAASWSNSYAGASAVPSSGGMTLLSTTTLSGASTAITGINQTYTRLLVVFYGVSHSTSALTSILMNGNATYAALCGTFNAVASTTGDVRPFSNTAVAVSGGHGVLTLDNYASAGGFVPINVYGYGNNNNSTTLTNMGGGFNNANPITSLTFSISTGTYTGGTVKVYGVN